ncbi:MULTISPECIES: VOC family protein [unclassified Streptomyces]|nr:MULTISPECIES: VOC family protein [unclassified Streptomyces]MYR98487.1 VOC family protein [Streptomyces sp. SID4937]
MTMPITTEARPVRGAPCWVNLLVRDLPAAQAFYAAVLGWKFDDSDLLGEGFSVALADGRPVAGIGARSPFLAAPTVWTPYFASADVNGTADRIRERGATVAVGPLAVGEGRAAIASDRDGAVFGIWEGAAPLWSGAAGSLPWLELWTRDAFEAALFYGEVFSWPRPGPDGVDVAYEEEQIVARVGGRPMAVLSGGAVGSAPDPRIRPRWIVHFQVDDASRAAVQADRAGGETFPSPGVRSSEYVVRDPEGALFTVAEEAGVSGTGT